MALVDRSLVQREHENRFSMLGIVHDYASERFAKRPEQRKIRVAHARHMLNLVDRAASHMRGEDQQVARREVALEQDNVRAALRWMFESNDLDSASRIQVSLIVFWWVQGYVAEARRWAEELLARADEMDPASRARAHLTAGLTSGWEGDYARAAALLETAIDEFRALHDPLGTGVAEMALAYVLPAGGDYERKEALLLDSAADLYQAGDLWIVNVALQSRADVALASGHLERARDLFQDGLELARKHGDSRGMAHARVGLGFVSLQGGAVREAEALFRSSVSLSLELGNPEVLSHALRGMAGVAHADQQPCRAAVLLGAAQAVAEQSGSVDWPVRRRLYAVVEQDVRAQLGPAQFGEALAKGRELSMQAAGQLALAPAPAASAGCAGAPRVAERRHRLIARARQARLVRRSNEAAESGASGGRSGAGRPPFEIPPLTRSALRGT
jgi:tetratricopeptide (TPR) repeat protein